MKYAEEKEVLIAAFDKTEAYRKKQGSNTFGRGISMGEYCLENYFPKWFQRWRDAYTWHVALFLHDWEGFLVICNAFGRTEDDFWKMASPFIEYWKKNS